MDSGMHLRVESVTLPTPDCRRSGCAPAQELAGNGRQIRACMDVPDELKTTTPMDTSKRAANACPVPRWRAGLRVLLTGVLALLVNSGSVAFADPAQDAATSRASCAGSGPLVLYTDIESGPITGGERNQGIYLSIFGKNLGESAGREASASTHVYVNDTEVASYRYFGASRGRAEIKQITVQLGAIPNPKPGLPLPIKVVVGGAPSNTDHTFTVAPGAIFFVDNEKGNDATGVAGDIAHPFRYVQLPDVGRGVFNLLRPGDFVVMRGTATPWQDLGSDSYFIKFLHKGGTPFTQGAKYSGPITITGYPGESASILLPHSTGAKGAISGVDGQAYPGTNDGKYITISNLEIDTGGDNGAVNLQVHGDFWRVVNNDIAAKTADSKAKAGGIAGNGLGAFFYGNHIHDIGGDPKVQQNHGIYVDGDGTYDIGFNIIERIQGGNGFQIYANGSNGSSFADDVTFHHNSVSEVSKHGLNIADGSRDRIAIFNNVIYNVSYAGIRFNTTSLRGARIYNNTIFNIDTAGSPLYGALTNDWNLRSDALDVENNIFVPNGERRPYSAGSVSIGSAGHVGIFRNNLWHNGSGAILFDSHPQSSDPQFVRTGADFHLASAASAAVDTGTSGVSTLVKDDYDATVCRPQGRGYDIGAFEFSH